MSSAPNEKLSPAKTLVPAADADVFLNHFLSGVEPVAAFPASTREHCKIPCISSCGHTGRRLGALRSSRKLKSVHADLGVENRVSRRHGHKADQPLILLRVKVEGDRLVLPPG